MLRCNDVEQYALSFFQPSRIMSSGLLLAARIFRFAPPNMTGEVYLTLAMHLINMSESATATNLPLDLNLEDQKTTILLKKVNSK